MEFRSLCDLCRQDAGAPRFNPILSQQRNRAILSDSELTENNGFILGYRIFTTFVIGNFCRFGQWARRPDPASLVIGSAVSPLSALSGRFGCGFYAGGRFYRTDAGNFPDLAKDVAGKFC